MSSANSLINNQNVRNHPTPDLAIQLKELEGRHEIDGRMIYVSPSLVKGLGEILSPLLQDGRIPIPFLYPRTDSEVSAEWTIGHIEISVDIHPAEGRLYMLASRVGLPNPMERAAYEEEYGWITREEMTQHIREFFLGICHGADLLVLAKVDGPDYSLILDPPLVSYTKADVRIELVVDDPGLGVLAFGNSFDQLAEEVKRQLLVNWSKYGRCDPVALSANERQLREQLLGRVRVVWKSGITE
jgi:hypothetical protein